MKLVPALLLLVCVTSWSCKKEEPVKEPEPTPPAVQTGELKIKVIHVNAVGDTTSEHGGVKVTLQTGATATTNAEGIVSFQGLPYGSYAPSLLRSGHEGAPAAIQLQNASQQAELPIVQHSAHQLTKLECQIISSSTINLYFEVNNPIPAKGLKMAILSNTLAASPGKFLSADVVTIGTQTVTALNIAALPDLTSVLNGLVKGSVFYITAIPLSYGLYPSNLTLKPVLMGEALYTYNNIQLIKNW